MTMLASSLILSSLAVQGLTLFGGAGVHWYENRGQWPETTLYGMQLTQGWATLERDGVVLYLFTDEAIPTGRLTGGRGRAAAPRARRAPRLLRVRTG